MLWQDRDKISEQSIIQSLVSLAIPAVMSTMFSVIFEIIDMYWISRIGPVQTAAMSAASFFIWMLRGLGLITSTGAIALVSRRTGEKNEKGLLETVVYSLISTFIFSVIILVVFFPMALRVFHWTNLESNVGGFSEEYTTIFLSGLIFVFMMNTCEYIIRGIGNTRLPMMIMGISLGVNAILDPVFIFVFKMGMKGAAYGTVFSEALGATLMMVVLLKKIPELRRVTPEVVSFSRRIITKFFFDIVKIGGMVGLSDAGFSFIYVMLSGIISHFGKEPLAAIGIAHRFEGLPFFISLGVSMAVSPMVGQFLGAGAPQRAKETVYLSLKILSAILLGISVIYFFAAPFLFGIFSSDPLIIRHGTEYLRMVAVFEVFLGFEVVFTGAFSGAGDTKPLFLIVFPVTFLRIPFSYLFGILLGMGTKAIWFTITFTTFLKGILLFLRFRQGKWEKKKI